ncbi:hypothetical protein HDU78_011322, partial [Chytriomyces hyalinus]
MNEVFWVQYQTNQPVKIKTHYVGGQKRRRPLSVVADVIGAAKQTMAPHFDATPTDELTLHAVVDGVESTLPGNLLLSLIPTASCSFDNPLIIKSLNGIKNTRMDLSRRASDPWGNEVAVLLESIGSSDSEGVIIGEKRT